MNKTWKNGIPPELKINGINQRHSDFVMTIMKVDLDDPSIAFGHEITSFIDRQIAYFDYLKSEWITATKNVSSRKETVLKWQEIEKIPSNVMPRPKENEKVIGFLLDNRTFVGNYLSNEDMIHDPETDDFIHFIFVKSWASIA